MRRYRWTILALGTAAQWSYSAVFLGIPVLAPQLREAYGLSLTQIGVVLAAFSIGSVVTLLPWGLLADRVGERRVLATGLAAASIALAVAAFTSTWVGLVLLLVVAGGAGASVNAASGRAVMSWFEPTQRGLALGIRQTALPLGGAAAAVALPPIAAAGGTEAGLLVLAGACLVTAVAGAVGLREAPPDDGVPLGDVTNPLRDSRMWRLATGSGLIVVAQISVMAFTVLFLHGARGLSTATAAGIFAGMQFIGAGLRVAAGRWSDRVGTRIGPLVKIAVALSVTLAVSAALTSAPLALLLPAFLAAGAISQAWNSLSFTAAAELAGLARAGAALGFQQTALAVATSVAPPVFALLVDSTSWGVAFALAAALPLAGAGVLRRVPA
ncbi:MAG TPA: MFS transporter [Gaiellaceae bacterium]|nr:MFS transporter [Gaiellaceae bacterium]